MACNPKFICFAQDYLMAKQVGTNPARAGWVLSLKLDAHISCTLLSPQCARDRRVVKTSGNPGLITKS